jgi:hypothetical protein
MRFLHADFAPLKAYLTSNPVAIRRLEWELNPVVKDAFSIFALKPKLRPAAAPRAATLDDVAQLFERTRTIPGGAHAPWEYFHVNAPPSDRAVSLRAAVEHVEAFGGPAEFLIAGYHDGGLISVSRLHLPFQDDAKEARWWAPETRWGTS